MALDVILRCRHPGIPLKLRVCTETNLNGNFKFIVTITASVTVTMLSGRNDPWSSRPTCACRWQTLNLGTHPIPMITAQGQNMSRGCQGQGQFTFPVPFSTIYTTIMKTSDADPDDNLMARVAQPLASELPPESSRLWYFIHAALLFEYLVRKQATLALISSQTVSLMGTLANCSAWAPTQGSVHIVDVVDDL